MPTYRYYYYYYYYYYYLEFIGYTTAAPFTLARRKGLLPVRNV